MQYVASSEQAGVKSCSAAGEGLTPAYLLLAMCCFLQDIYSLFHLQRPFKFISKTSNFLIPIVGWSMFLTGAHDSQLLFEGTAHDGDGD